MGRPKKDAPPAAVVVEKPDFAQALRIIVADVKPTAEKAASARGDLSAAWKQIEDVCRCNRQAAKMFAKLREMSEEKRDDYLRTLYGLMKEAGIGLSADLVDLAGGEKPDMPTVERKAPELETLGTIN